MEAWKSFFAQEGIQANARIYWWEGSKHYFLLDKSIEKNQDEMLYRNDELWPVNLRKRKGDNAYWSVHIVNNKSFSWRKSPEKERKKKNPSVHGQNKKITANKSRPKDEKIGQFLLTELDKSQKR